MLNEYFGNEEAENRTKVLTIIKDLRTCKAHYKDLLKTLKKYNFDDKSPREIYKKLITELEDFLRWLCELCKVDRFA